MLYLSLKKKKPTHTHTQQNPMYTLYIEPICLHG